MFPKRAFCCGFLTPPQKVRAAQRYREINTPIFPGEKTINLNASIQPNPFFQLVILPPTDEESFGQRPSHS